MSQGNNQELVQSLLITGAGMLVGGAVMAAISARNNQSTSLEIEEDSSKVNAASPDGKGQKKSKSSLKKNQSIQSVDKGNLGLKRQVTKMKIPRNVSSNLIHSQMKKKGSFANLNMQQTGSNYQQIVKKNTMKYGLDLLEQARPIIDMPTHLMDVLEYDDDDPFSFYESPLLGDNVEKGILGGSKFLPIDSFMIEDAFVVSAKDHRTIKDVATSVKFLKAGPRKDIFFNPDTVKAAIVTCGGLCPGLNVVIREIVMSLYYNYEVRDIYGIKWGYKGFYTDVEENWVKLRPKDVMNIHKQGGTILGSSRGGFDGDKILGECLKKGITQVYIIGGDGTHRGIYNLSKLAEERGLKIAFAGVPKTIDNDIPIIESSFGFSTSCDVAAEQIQAAYIEATGVINGIGLIKLMGRDSGFIAMKASLAHQGVDFCLVPENPFELNGPNGLYAQVYERVKSKGHAVVVVSEGAETGLINLAEKFTKDADKDGSGNVKLDDIGLYLKDEIPKQIKKNNNFTVNLKYLDPTYLIRSPAANASDTVMCAKLAQNAIHGAMAGYTAFSTGVVKDATCWIPIKTINQAGTNKISVFDRMFLRLLGSIKQRPMLNKEFEGKAKERVQKDEDDRAQKLEAIKERIQQEETERENRDRSIKF